MTYSFPVTGDDVVTRQQALPLLTHLTRLGIRAAENSMTPGGLRPRHLIALQLLSEHGPAGQQSLAEALSLDPSNVVGLLNELEERELVTRRRDSADRRRHIVELSPLGEEQHRLANERLSQVEDHLLSGLTLEERATLYELLSRAVGAVTSPCMSADAVACAESGVPDCTG